MKPLLHGIQFLLYRLFSAALGFLPLVAVRNLGGWLGQLVYERFGFRRDIVAENVKNAFPELSESEREAIALEAFRSVGISLLELAWFPHLTAERLRSIVHLEQADILREKLAKGKGAIVLTAHIGNWELISPAYMVLAGIRVDALYKPQSNPWIDRRIVKLRTKFGTNLIPMGMGVREVLGILQSGRSILIAADQSAPKESVRMQFFGREVPVFQGPAVFCLKTGAPLIASYVVRNPDGSYILTCSEIPSEDLSYDDASVRELTRRHLEETERIIRQYPGQWMWMHRRWKHASADHEIH